MIKTLEISVVSKCAVNCSFCAQDVLAVAYGQGEKTLTLANYIATLEKLPKDVRICFAGYVEPFLNPQTPEMIAHAIDAGFHEVQLFSTLIGLREAGVKILASHRPNYNRIHVPDQVAMRIPDATWIRQHEIWRQTGIPCSYMSMGELTPGVNEYLTGLGVTVDKPTMLSRSGNVWKVEPKVGRVICAMNRYHENVLLPNGEVYGCCMTYAGEIKLGNLFTEPYQAIWDRAEQWKADENPPEDSPCRKCDWCRVL